MKVSNIISTIVNFFKKLFSNYDGWTDFINEGDTKVFNCKDLIMVGKIHNDYKTNKPSFTLLYPTIRIVVFAKGDSQDDSIKLSKLRAEFIDSIGSHSIVTMKYTMNCYINYEYKPN